MKRFKPPCPKNLMAQERVSRMSEAELRDLTAERLVASFGITAEQAERIVKTAERRVRV
jgi:hypothetical protein